MAPGVDDRRAREAPLPVPAAADVRHRRDGRHAALPSALRVGRIEPEAGDADPGEPQLPHVGARVPRHRAGPALRQPVHAHLPGRPLDHARAGARGARLGDRGGERPVHPLVAVKDVLGEEAAPPGLRDPGRERPHAGQWPALPAAVPAVALAAHPVGPAPMVSLATPSASRRSSPRMSIVPSWNLGMVAPPRVTVGGASGRLCVAAIAPFPRIRPVAISDSGTMAASSRPTVKPDDPFAYANVYDMIRTASP